MKKFLRTFDTEEEYLAYTASTEYYLNSVARCRQGSLVFYNPEDCGYVPPTPPTEWDIIAKFNVTDTSNPTEIANIISNFSKIEIDGVIQPSVVSTYTFSTLGEHTVKYVLVDKTSISNGAFYECRSLTSIDIPNSITSIGGAAFYLCSSLTRLNSNVDGVFNIPSGVTSIGEAVFADCRSLTSITIPNGVTIINNDTFNGCDGLISITMPSGVTSINSRSFRVCTSLTSITIPSNITYIGVYAFEQCSSLTSITCNAVTPPTLMRYAFDDTNNCPIYVPCDSVDAYKAATNWSNYASRIQAIPGSCWDITAKFNVTSTSGSTKIASGTTGFSKIMIDGVEQQSVISAYTFSSTGEHTVKYALKDPISISRYALAGCTSLTNCIISSGVTSIGNNAFRYNSNLSSIYIPNSVTSIGEASFYYCSGLTSVTIPSGITSIERSTFIGCTSLSNVNIPSGVTSIGTSSFHWCSSLTSIDIPNGVTSIDSSAFSNCSGLTSVTIPDSVTSIGNNAFYLCTSLTSCTIGSGVTSIGESALSNCRSLTSITVNATTPPTLANVNAFNNTNNCPIYVPCDSVDVYKETTNWSSYASRIQAIPGSCPIVTVTFNVTDTTNPTKIANVIGEIKKIEIDGVTQSISTGYTFDTAGEHIVKYRFNDPTEIPSYIFSGCTNVTSIEMPDSVTRIGHTAFYNCRSLTSITMSDSVTSIGADSFRKCASLKNIVIPDGVTRLSPYFFDYCTSLTSCTIGSGFTYMDNYIFDNCKIKTIICRAMIAPVLESYAVLFYGVMANGTLYVPMGSSGYDAWMSTDYGYLGAKNWTKVEQ